MVTMRQIGTVCRRLSLQAGHPVASASRAYLPARYGPAQSVPSSSSLQRRLFHPTHTSRSKWEDGLSSEADYMGDAEGLEEVESEKDDSFELDPPPPKRTTRRRQKKIEVIADPTQRVPHLPDPKTWTNTLARGSSAALSSLTQTHRWFLSNPDTCEDIIKALELDQETSAETGESTTVIEGYPGPGIMTRSFLNAKGVDKVISLEGERVYYQGLQNLFADPTVQTADERLVTLPNTAYAWDSYQQVINEGLLDHIPEIRKRRPSNPDYSKGYFDDPLWTDPSRLLFFAQLPSTVQSEQLLSQLMRAISNRLWLFRFGRARLAVMCSEHLAERCFAQPGSRLRGKFTIVVSTFANVRILRLPEAFEPQSEHFHPKIEVGGVLPKTLTANSIQTLTGPLKDKETRQRQCLLLIEPKTNPLIQGEELAAFDYVLKHLFILRASPIRKALEGLAAGAASIVDRINDVSKPRHPALKRLEGPIYIDPDTTPSNLTIEQVVALSLMFDRWPFRQANLFDEGNTDEVSLKKASAFP